MSIYDLIIIGAGNSGIPAAIAAADLGARVLVVEKRPVVGGMLWVSGGQFSGAGTRRQERRGIVDSPTDHFNDVMRISHGKADPNLVRLSVGLQGEMVDWLESIDLDFHPDCPRTPFGHEVYRIARTYHGVDNGRSLLRLFTREINRRAATGSLDLRTGLRAIGLISEGGAVVGVRAQPVGEDGSPNGETLEFRARSTLLASGGFAANPDLIARFTPPADRGYLAACLDYAVGDGLHLAESVGARVTEFCGTLPSVALIPDPNRPGFTLFWHQVHVLLPPQMRTPFEIWVDRNGNRFINEDHPSAEARDVALREIPGRRMAIVWDEHIMATADPIFENDANDWTRERIRAEAEREQFVWRAESLPALAAKIGVDPGGLERAVARYNGYVRAGEDPDFGRRALPLPIERPPYYGLVSEAGMLLSREGVRVNTELQVLGADGTALPGLYAVGEVLGASRFMGDAFASGMSVGPAMALGRWIGGRLARNDG